MYVPDGILQPLPRVIFPHHLQTLPIPAFHEKISRILLFVQDKILMTLQKFNTVPSFSSRAKVQVEYTIRPPGFIILAA